MQTIEDQGLLPNHQGCKGNVHQLDLQEGGVCPGAISRILIQKKVLNAFSPHKTKRSKTITAAFIEVKWISVMSCCPDSGYTKSSTWSVTFVPL